MGHEVEVLTERKFIQEHIIPRLMEMMVADWDNFEDPRLAAEELYASTLMYLNPPRMRGREALPPIPQKRGKKYF